LDIVHKNLLEVLGLVEREHLAIVGAGGKTTLLLSLAKNIRENKVVISTTTKIHYDEARQALRPIINLQQPDWKEILKKRLDLENQAVLVKQIIKSGKVSGISPSLADEIFRDQKVGYLLLEADGAAGRPIKAPSENEPVIPSSVTKVVAMMGLDVINQPFNQEKVFREKEFQRITGISRGEKLIPKKIFQLFIDPRGLFKGTPPSAKKIVFLNRLDLLSNKRQAFALAELIANKKRRSIDRIIIGSLKNNEYYLQ
jgi:probable selenium-dependent hydroxylase accessory protein YqeC